MAEYVKIEGLNETVAALRALPAQFASKNGGPIKRALYKAALIIKLDAIARAPKATGNLAANIYIYRDRNPRASGANEKFYVGVRKKRAKYARTRLNTRLGRVGKNYSIGGDAYYWHFLEFGTKDEFGTEKMSPKPFLRPAFESNKSNALNTFSQEFRRGVDAAVKRARRKQSSG